MLRHIVISIESAIFVYFLENKFVLSDTNVNDSVVCITKGFSVIAFLVFLRMFYFVWFIERLIESVKMLFLRDEK